MSRSGSFPFIALCALAVVLLPRVVVSAPPGGDKSATTTPVHVDPNAASKTAITAPSAQTTPKLQLPQTKPADMKANLPGNVVNTAPKVDLQQGTATKVAPEIRPNLDNANTRGIEEANAARGLKDLKAGEGLRNMPGAPTPGQGINPDLGLGKQGSGLPGTGKNLPGHDFPGSDLMPDLPSNQDKSRQGGSPLTPSSNPADWMSGAAAQGRGRGGSRPLPDNFFDHYDGTPYPGNGGRNDGAGMIDGAYISSFWRNRHTGEQRVVHLDNNGNVIGHDSKTVNGDGSVVVTSSRGGNMVEIVRTADGDVTKMVNGREVPDRPQTGFDKILDPNSDDSDGAWARWLAKAMGKDPDLSLKNPNQVDPGPDGAAPNPQAPRLVLPEDQLVINPSPESAGGQARQISAEQARALQDQLRDKAKGPGGHPGDPDGPGQ
jgi:hypothetical protein